MNEYNVLVREVHICHVAISASSESEAIRKVLEGEGESGYLEYSHTLDSENWTVENNANPVEEQ